MQLKRKTFQMKVSQVSVRQEPIILPTYEPLPPDKNPMFLEKRVYQGSSGRVYPLPFYDRISEKSVPRTWKAIYLENEFLEVMILPEIGGRIHAAKDKTNGYDIFYRQDVIKPALVGLAGPWISGGVEFNWPQHHRPATYMPVDTEIERGADGSITVWCSDHDPMQRMKGMHGICLHPARSVIEVKVRAYNRTAHTQTFLWWANVATRVHEEYQSFFPPDVNYVADHARRSMSTYPLCEGHYYGVDYAARAKDGVDPAEAPAHYVPPASGGKCPISYAANDLSFYANIPVPTSYMCMGSEEDFFGGYDHREQAGVVHVANHHISPGKKQWTWGNHDFGYAWDRSLTDATSTGEHPPYIEIMAGVYTDNQPDFAFLLPGETKTWSQFWYPIRQIGPASHANTNAAVSLRLEKSTLRIGVSVSQVFRNASVTLEAQGQMVFKGKATLSPNTPFLREIKIASNVALHDLRLTVKEHSGSEVITYSPVKAVRKPVPDAATEPPAPAEISSNDELYLTGLHLDQYRHATRNPEPYWQEAIRRDAGDSRCHTALGIRHLKRGEFDKAESHLRSAITRLAVRNTNPATGDAHYHLGLTLRHLGREREAYAAFYKSVWNQEWQSAGYLAIAELDCCSRHWTTALDHLDRSLRMDTDNLRARNLRAIVLRKLNRKAEAEILLASTRKLDPLDWACRSLLGEPLGCDTQTSIDITLDLATSGFYSEAASLLKKVSPDPGSKPLVFYWLGWLEEKAGRTGEAQKSREKARKSSPDHCFPSRLEEIEILESAIRANPTDARALFYLGNLFYDRRRHPEAINLWERAVKIEPDNSVAWRNLGIGYFNILHQPAKARAAYEKAFRANPSDARLLYERDQLWKRTGEPLTKRLRALESHRNLVALRDDLSVELCALYNQTGAPEKARKILSTRNFQPWEGGEGQALGQHVRTHLALGRRALTEGDGATAVSRFEEALQLPLNLAEAKHLLANQSDIHYWLGEAFEKTGDIQRARQHWKTAAAFRGDFQSMSVRAFSEMTYFSALAWKRLGKPDRAKSMFNELLAYARDLQKQIAKIDYFATSLPTMLLFDEDIQAVQVTTALFLQAQALLGLGRKSQALALAAEVLRRAPNHALASDLLLT